MKAGNFLDDYVYVKVGLEKRNLTEVTLVFLPVFPFAAPCLSSHRTAQRGLMNFCIAEFY
jgi:hypothetical protein